MSKVYGLVTEFTPVRRDVSRVVCGYNMQAEPDGVHATWNEVYFYKKQHPNLSLQEIKEAITADINAETHDRIVTALVWNDKPVWLSNENQANWNAAYAQAKETEGGNLPVRFKIGETDEGEPVYQTFDALAVFEDFHNACLAHIQQCLTDGWDLKDSIAWSLYDDGSSQPE